MKAGRTFEIEYRTDDAGKHYITFCPSKKAVGFPDKEIEVTKEQLEALKYHFASAIGYDPNGEQIQMLAYIP